MLLLTERCMLCNLQETDFAEAEELFTNKQVREYLGGVITKQQAQSKLQFWIKSKVDLYFCVRMIETNDFVGIVSVSSHHNNANKELSYQFMPQYWGQGIATEVIKCFLDYLRLSSFVKEIIAETQSLNVRSCKLLENLGFSIKSIIWRFDAEQKIYSLSFN